MTNISEVIVNKLKNVAKNKGYELKERGVIKNLARKYLESTNYESLGDSEKDKELNKVYRTFKNFFTDNKINDDGTEKKPSYSSDTLDMVAVALGVKDVMFSYDMVA